MCVVCVVCACYVCIMECVLCHVYCVCVVYMVCVCTVVYVLCVYVGVWFSHSPGHCVVTQVHPRHLRSQPDHFPSLPSCLMVKPAYQLVENAESGGGRTHNPTTPSHHYFEVFSSSVYPLE